MPEVKLKVATVNTPQGHRDSIPHSARARVVFLVDLLNRLGISVLAVQEFGPLLRLWWIRRALWIIKGAPANSVGKGGRRVGNAAAFRHDVELVHRRALRYRVSWRKGLRIGAVLRRRISFVALLLRDPETGLCFVFISVHMPTLKYVTADERVRLNAALIAYCKRLRLMNLPVIVAGDFNEGKPAAWLRNGFVLGATEHVDHILGSGVVFTDPRYDESVHHTVTDHRALVYVTAHMSLPPKPVVVRELPKV